MTTNAYIRGVKQNSWTPFPGKLWQRSYYEHVIRNDDELNRLRNYIANNPIDWELDKYHPGQAKKSGSLGGTDHLATRMSSTSKLQRKTATFSGLPFPKSRDDWRTTPTR